MSHAAKNAVGVRERDNGGEVLGGGPLVGQIAAAQTQKASRGALSRAIEITRALAHGHVAAVLGTVRRLGLDKALPKGPERRAKLQILAMIVARIIEPAAKLATARQLSEATAAHSLGALLGLGDVETNSTPPSTSWAAGAAGGASARERRYRRRQRGSAR